MTIENPELTNYAFPFNMPTSEGTEWHCPGMTLRDWFAGQVIGSVVHQLGKASNAEFMSLASNRGMTGDKARTAPVAATMSYEIADELLAARSKT